LSFSVPYNLALFFLMNDDTTLFTNQLNTELGINTAGFALLSEVKRVKRLHSISHEGST
jgi:hypothetical protein